MYLIECFEAYAERHTLDGFEPKHADEELSRIRKSVDSGSRGGASARALQCAAAPIAPAPAEVHLCFK